MNGNDLNNMAKRYKDEMMRLYQKSEGQRNMQMNNNMNRNANPMPQNNMNGNMQNMQMGQQPMRRDIAGTPVPDTPNASFFSANNSSAVNNKGVNVPVSCDCRFPSAESIINGIANTPMTLPITPEDNPPPVESGHNPIIQPRANVAEEILGAQNGPTQSTDAVAIRSIILNMTPSEQEYMLTTQNEDEAEVLPDFTLPADLPADSERDVPSTAAFSPSQPWISLTGDNSWGFLQFEVYTSEGDFPLRDALVTVKKRLPGGVGLVRFLYTNRNGKTPTIALPAPANCFLCWNGTRQFSEYEVTVRARGYYTLRNLVIPVFAATKTVQPIDMIPLPSFNPQFPAPPQPRSNSDGSSVG